MRSACTPHPQRSLTHRGSFPIFPSDTSVMSSTPTNPPLASPSPRPSTVQLNPGGLRPGGGMALNMSMSRANKATTAIVPSRRKTPKKNQKPSASLSSVPLLGPAASSVVVVVVTAVAAAAVDGRLLLLRAILPWPFDSVERPSQRRFLLGGLCVSVWVWVSVGCCLVGWVD